MGAYKNGLYHHAWTVYRLVPCKMMKFVRILTQMLLLDDGGRALIVLTVPFPTLITLPLGPIAFLDANRNALSERFTSPILPKYSTLSYKLFPYYHGSVRILLISIQWSRDDIFIVGRFIACCWGPCIIIRAVGMEPYCTWYFLPLAIISCSMTRCFHHQDGPMASVIIC